MASYIHTNRAIFADLIDDVFDRYVEHMLRKVRDGLGCGRAGWDSSYR